MNDRIGAVRTQVQVDVDRFHGLRSRHDVPLPISDFAAPGFQPAHRVRVMRRLLGELLVPHDLDLDKLEKQPRKTQPE